jgi:glycine/D-amino acid oxidase-like deaminating enzyme
MASDFREVNPRRRTFLKKAAIAGAGTVAAAAGINAIAPIVMPEETVFETNRSYWSKELPPANPALDENIDVDVAIIGGGFTGLSSAYYIRKNSPNKRVAVLEAKACGNGASGRNGAMMLTMTDDRFMTWSDEPELDKRIYELTVGNIAAMKDISASAGMDCEIEQNGALQVCNTPEIAAEGKSYVERTRDAGIPFEYWTKEQISAALGTDAYAGGLFDPGSGQLHPGKLVGMWKAAAQFAGAEIYEGTTVVHVEEGRVHSLKTSHGRTVRANSLVIATNAYSSKLGYLRRAVAPVFDYVGITPSLDTSLIAEIGWKSRIPFNDSRTEVYYLGITRDNRIHIGGGPVDYSFNDGLRDRSDSARRYATIQCELGRIFPKLGGVDFETTWSGSVDMSVDGSPAVGAMGRFKNVFYGIGFSGHGVNLTSVFGRIIADLEAGRGEQWNWLPFVNRLPPYIPNEPFRWLGIQVALDYYRRKDPAVP